MTIKSWSKSIRMLGTISDRIAHLKEATCAHRFYKYDTEEAEDIAHELGVNMMPSFHIFKDGEPVQSVTGAKGKQLEEAIKGCYDGKVEEE